MAETTDRKLDAVRALIEEADRAGFHLMMGDSGATAAIRKKNRQDAAATGKRLTKCIGKALVECGMFTLTCYSCDDGAGITTPAQAKRKGWTDLQPDPNGPTATFLGMCPECKESGDHG